MVNNVTIEKIVENIRKLPEKDQIFGLFVLVSGLRTEAIDAFNNHKKICRNGILEISRIETPRKPMLFFAIHYYMIKLTSKSVTQEYTEI